METCIYSSDFIEIIEENEEIYIKVLKKGLSLQAFHEVIKPFPRISILHFVALKTALEHTMSSKTKIGLLKNLVEISVSSDKMLAQGLINLSKDEFEDYNKKELLTTIIALASKAAISYGVDIQGIMSAMKPGEKFDIARGIAPTPGEDAYIKTYEIMEVEPLLISDGKVNHYELNLINKVVSGDWLGERKEPTQGISGINILGEEVLAPNGQQEKLLYDPRTVGPILDEDLGITTLQAKCAGAVVYNNQSVGVCDVIEISGDVGFQTGNVDFDGFVNITRTVDDNFSVRALYDVQILGDLGIGGVDIIESVEGKVYIRGGIAGKNKAKIICRGDFYTKFASDCTIECQGTVNIGFYAMNCNITAQEVILESPSSKIIGGVTTANYKVEVGELGSKANIPTRVIIQGFDRERLKKDATELGESIEKCKVIIETLKGGLARYAKDSDNLTERKAMEVLEQELDKNKKNLALLLENKKKVTDYLRTKGEGEVKVKKAIHQRSVILMRDEKLIIQETINLPMDYFLEDDEIKMN